ARPRMRRPTPTAARTTSRTTQITHDRRRSVIKTGVVRTFRSARHGRPEGLHYNDHGRPEGLHYNDHGVFHSLIHIVILDIRSYGRLTCMPPVTRSGRPSPV